MGESGRRGKVTVINWVTLDGVMQSPGRADEDTRGGFDRGGWATSFSDDTVGAKMGEHLASDFAWLFGRHTYEGLLESWNAQGGPFKESLNNTVKYVASGDATTMLRWPNSHLLHGDVAAEVAALKQRSDTDLVIMGSGVLIGSLMAKNLIDEFVLLIAPIVLGRGRRLFGDGVDASLWLLDCTPASTGAVVATYASTAGVPPDRRTGD